MNDALESFVPITVARRGVQQLTTTDAPAFDATLLQGLGELSIGSTCLIAALQRAARISHDRKVCTTRASTNSCGSRCWHRTSLPN